MILPDLHQLALCKQLLLAAALFTGTMFTNAQTTIAVSPNKMNVLYIGVDNPVSVAASGGADSKLTVSINGGAGTISKTGAGLYNVHVEEVTDDCVISVYVDEKLAGTTTFRVRRLPTPFGTIGGYKSGDNISSAVFQGQAGVGVYLIDFPFDVHYQVAGYTFTVDTDKGDVMTVDCEGASFSPRAKEVIAQHVKPGRTVTIDKIRVKDAGGKELKVPSLVYFIK